MAPVAQVVPDTYEKAEANPRPSTGEPGAEAPGPDRTQQEAVQPQQAPFV